MTLSELQNRHSVRAFSNQPLTQEIIDELNAEITMVNTTEAGMHFQLCINDDKPFKGFTRSYGFFRNPKNYIACVIDKTYPNAFQRAGFFAQQIVMKAVSLGLGTCYVGGTYNAKNVSARVRVGQELPFIILLGYSEEDKTTFIAKLAKKMIKGREYTPTDYLDTAFPIDIVCAKFPMLYQALEAVACAPSSYNKRPTIIQVSADRYTDDSSETPMPLYRDSGSDNRAVMKMHQALYTDNNISDNISDNIRIHAIVETKKNRKNLIDLGIAMYNFQAVYPGYWEWGNPATFIPDEL